MKEQDILEEKAREELKYKAQRLAIIEKLKAMGFTEEQIAYNFSNAGKIKAKFTGKLSND